MHGELPFQRFFAFSILALLICLVEARAQYFVTNQNRYFDLIGLRADIQIGAPLGQSFVAVTNATRWVDFRITDRNPANELGGVLHVNLRRFNENPDTHLVTGEVLAASAPVTILDSFSARVRFIFSNNVPLVMGTKYWWEVVWDSGDNLALSIYHLNFNDVEAVVYGRTDFTIDDAAYNEGTIEFPSLQWTRSPNQLLILTANGFTNLGIIFQQSSNLAAWTSVMTNPAVPAQLIIPMAGEGRFYRAIYDRAE